MTRRKFISHLKRVFQESQEAVIRYLIQEIKFLLNHLERRPKPTEAEKAALARAANIAVLEDLCDTMKLGSLCALGGFTPYPVMSALDHFLEDFGGADVRRAAE